MNGHACELTFLGFRASWSRFLDDWALPPANWPQQRGRLLQPMQRNKGIRRGAVNPSVGPSIIQPWIAQSINKRTVTTLLMLLLLLLQYTYHPWLNIYDSTGCLRPESSVENGFYNLSPDIQQLLRPRNQQARLIIGRRAVIRSIPLGHRPTQSVLGSSSRRDPHRRVEFWRRYSPHNTDS